MVANIIKKLNSGIMLFDCNHDNLVVLFSIRYKTKKTSLVIFLLKFGLHNVSSLVNNSIC